MYSMRKALAEGMCVCPVGDLQVYFFDQVLLLSSGVDYVAHDITNQLAHITNTARQTEGELSYTIDTEKQHMRRFFRFSWCLDEMIGTISE